MTGEQAFALYSDPRPGSTIRVEEVYMKQCTEPFHLDAPPEVVFAYLTDLIESGGRCCLLDDLDCHGDPKQRGHHVWARAAGEALRRTGWRVTTAEGPRR